MACISLGFCLVSRREIIFYLLLVGCLSFLAVPYSKHVAPVLAPVSPYYVLAAAAGVLALAAYSIRERFVVVLVVFLTASFAYGSIRGLTNPPMHVSAIVPIGSSDRREQTTTDSSYVIYLVLDEYMGPAGFPIDIKESKRAVRSIYSTFLEYGFTVYSHAFSNYDSTDDSLTSLLNLQPLEPRQSDQGAGSGQGARRNFKLFSHFRNKGYSLNIYQPRVHGIFNPSVPADRKLVYDMIHMSVLRDLDIPWTDRFLLLSSRFSVENLAFRLLDKNLCSACGRYGNVYLNAPWSLKVVDVLKQDLQAASQDTLAFAHLLMPHFSYLYRYDGSVWPASKLSRLGWPGSFQESDPRYRELHRGYAEQVRYLNKRLGMFFEHLDRHGLLDRSTVIVHGDHGARFLGKGQRTASFRRLLEAYSTLLAVRKPSAREGRIHSEPGSVLQFIAEELYGTTPERPIAANSVYVLNDDGTFSPIPFLRLWRERTTKLPASQELVRGVTPVP